MFCEPTFKFNFMKIKLITVLLAGFCQIAYSQTSFFETYKRSSHERAYSSLQMADGNFMIAGEMRETGYFGIDMGYLAKLSPTGEIVKEVLVNPKNTSRLCLLVPFQYENAMYLCIGSSDSVVGANSFGCNVFYGIDEDLNITQQKAFSFKTNYMAYPWQYVIQNDSILYLMTDFVIRNRNNTTNRMIDVVKYKLPFDSLTSYIDTNYSITQDLFFNNVKKQINIYTFPFNKIQQLDENLNFISSKTYSEKFPTVLTITSLGDTNYLLSGAAKNDSSPNLLLGCVRYDSNDFSVDSLFYTPSADTNFYGGAHKNTVINGDAIFITGFYNVNAIPFPYNDNPSWVTITKLDMELNVISTHFYGGDAQYCPYSIIATSDGGCFVTGYSYDYINNLPNGNGELDIFALKTNSEGLVTGNTEDPIAHNAIIYPNPGADFINIEAGLQIKGAMFTLYDMNGRILQQQPIKNTHQRVNASNLPSGIYPWQIVFKHKVIETGKWIK